MKSKIIAVFLSVVLLIGCFIFPVSAEAVLSVYNSSPMSSTYRDVFDGIVANYDYRTYPDLDYVYFRESEYAYKLIVCPFGGLNCNSSVDYPTLFEYLGDSFVAVYTLSTRQNNTTYYSLTSEFIQYNFRLYVNDGFVYSNLGAIGSESSSNSSFQAFVQDRLGYILIVVLMFMLLYVAFQFIRKRWFIQ